jgi:predicted N-acetyltransferase YhbS
VVPAYSNDVDWTLAAQPLGDDLVLRAVESDADAEKVIAINAEIHGSELGAVLRVWMFDGHPTIQRRDWLFVEDSARNQAVATLSLVPMTWQYNGHPLSVAELGFVATRPAFRRRGLQRALSAAFDRMALGRGFHLGAIEGIPGFYGQFGYTYAVPLVGGFDLEYDQVPEFDRKLGHDFRRATPDDGPALRQLYDASIDSLDLAARRDGELWTHQLKAAEHCTFTGTTTVIERGTRVVGYVRWTDDDWTDRLRILELAVEDGAGARERILSALRYAAERGKAAEKRGLKLQLPSDHPAVIIARYLGAADAGYYGWQMKVLDVIGFLRDIGRALELRLAQSPLAGFSGMLVFDLYRSRVALSFDKGQLIEVKEPDTAVEADAGMALEQATQLWLGWRSRDALEDWYPDFWSRRSARHLLDVLFPQARAYIYTPY